MPVPVITVAQMREWEKAAWASGQTEAEVIRRVGKRVGKRARKLTRSGDAILILAGKGNNGNDARAAGELIDDRQLEILNITSPENDALKLQDLLRRKFALIVDGLFGIGLNRPLDEHWQKFIATIKVDDLQYCIAFYIFYDQWFKTQLLRIAHCAIRDFNDSRLDFSKA